MAATGHEASKQRVGKQVCMHTTCYRMFGVIMRLAVCGDSCMWDGGHALGVFA